MNDDREWNLIRTDWVTFNDPMLWPLGNAWGICVDVVEISAGSPDRQKKGEMRRNLGMKLLS